MRSYFLLLALLYSIIAIACSHTDRVHSFTVIKYQKCGMGYHYSKNLFKYFDDIYRPLTGIEYNSDTIVSLVIFKSEGEVTYNKNELITDALLMLTFKLTEPRTLEVNGKKLMDNLNSYEINDFKGDSTFCKKEDTLILYVMK